MQQPVDILSAKQELAAVKKKMRKSARVFWSLMPGALAIFILIFGWGDMRIGVWVLVGVLVVWSLGTMLSVIPPGPWPRKYDPDNLHERVAYLEGFIRAAKEKK